MGYIRHHAIIVTSLDKEIEPLYAKAVEIFEDGVSAIVDSRVNGFRSFLVAPDGSKEGWDSSGQGDRRRERFVEWLAQRQRENPWGSLDWIHLQYGDDNRETRILGDSSEIVQEDQE